MPCHSGFFRRHSEMLSRCRTVWVCMSLPFRQHVRHSSVHYTVKQSLVWLRAFHHARFDLVLRQNTNNLDFFLWRIWCQGKVAMKSKEWSSFVLLEHLWHFVGRWTLHTLPNGHRSRNGMSCCSWNVIFSVSTNVSLKLATDISSSPLITTVLTIKAHV